MELMKIFSKKKKKKLLNSHINLNQWYMQRNFVCPLLSFSSELDMSNHLIIKGFRYNVLLIFSFHAGNNKNYRTDFVLFFSDQIRFLSRIVLVHTHTWHLQSHRHCFVTYVAKRQAILRAVGVIKISVLIM